MAGVTGWDETDAVETAFRQKLLNWLCSIGIVMLATVVPFVHYWLVKLPDYQSRIVGEINLAGHFLMLSEQLIFFVLYAPLIVGWHLADFIERRAPLNEWLGRSLDYPSLFWLLSLASLLYVLMSVGFLEYNSCDALPLAMYHSCIVQPSLVLMIPWVIATILALLLCIVKAVWSVWSLIKKPE